MIWTLDTCGFDDTNQNCQAEIDPGWIFVRWIRRCPTHVLLSDDLATFNQIHEENTRGSSNAFWTMLQNAPAALFDTDSGGTRTFKRGITVSWSWIGTFPNRILNITISGITLTTTQQNTIRNAVNNRFGSGKVNITFG